MVRQMGQSMEIQPAGGVYPQICQPLSLSLQNYTLNGDKQGGVGVIVK